MIKSHSMLHKDFSTDWYKRWAKALKQDKTHLDDHDLLANKFWQNAIITQALWERGVIGEGKKGIGFGVGQERLPSLFAKLGTDITATDQDFKTKKAGYWAEHELATGVQSLNKIGICDKEVFAQRVDYSPVNMSNIPAKLSGKYDFLWSNCALGHLGSIPAGLEFIIDSLKCLKADGWAVHTTELNVLSNDKTVDSGSTVIFRLKDIYALQKKLLKNGYVCDIFDITLGELPEDKLISMNPQFGNEYSKIQVMGHLATQIVLIINKPSKKIKSLEIAKLKIKYKNAYARNLRKIKRYKSEDQTIKSIIKSQKADVKSIVVSPVKKEIKVTIVKGNSKKLYIEFNNLSKIPLFNLYSRLADCNPISLATTAPNDRRSDFHDASWQGNNRNRPSYTICTNSSKKISEIADYIKPEQNFSFMVTLNSNSLPKGTYTEKLSLVQENVGWVDNSVVELVIKIV